MTRDKQLREIKLQEVQQKRDLDQALNAKEFAVLAGISYSVAREWFHLPGFPSVRGMVFWGDFVLWRRSQNQPKSAHNSNASGTSEIRQIESGSNPPNASARWPARAVRILAEVH